MQTRIDQCRPSVLPEFYFVNPFLPRCPFGALFHSDVRNSFNIGPIETLPVTSIGAFAHLFISNGIKLDGPTGIDRVTGIQSRPIELA